MTSCAARASTRTWATTRLLSSCACRTSRPTARKSASRWSPSWPATASVPAPCAATRNRSTATACRCGRTGLVMPSPTTARRTRNRPSRCARPPGACSAAGPSASCVTISSTHCCRSRPRPCRRAGSTPPATGSTGSSGRPLRHQCLGEVVHLRHWQRQGVRDQLDHAARPALPCLSTMLPCALRPTPSSSGKPFGLGKASCRPGLPATRHVR